MEDTNPTKTTAYRCKHCRQPVARNDVTEPWAHETDGILLTHECLYHKPDGTPVACDTPIPDFECPLHYNYNAHTYYVLARRIGATEAVKE